MSDPVWPLATLIRRQEELARRLARLAAPVERAAQDFARSRRPTDEPRR